MRTAGIDIGSRTVKVALAEEGRLVHTALSENSFEPLAVCRRLLADLRYDRIIATGYGRHLFASEFECEAISEIRAVAVGVKHLAPTARTVLDIGGQDVKAITLAEQGKLSKFEMNDRCAAGTGRFLEIMAMALGTGLEGLSELAASATAATPINSMCTVFAESEVVSSIARGANKEEIALGVHKSVVRRVTQMLKRVGAQDDIYFVGGVALNCSMRKLLESELGRPILTPDSPQLVAASGCALL